MHNWRVLVKLNVSNFSFFTKTLIFDCKEDTDLDTMFTKIYDHRYLSYITRKLCTP